MRQGNHLKVNYYVDGNTVRRLEGEPEERRRKREEQEQERRRQVHRRAARRNQERALHINLSYVLFCAMAILATCIVCIAYIRLQSDITGRTKRISGLESQIMELKADNDAALRRIELSTDLGAVKEQALQYGMKYAGEGQIVYYSVQDNDYMDQYSDVPEK